ncbi:MAG: WD40 repeat domain-containing protein [Candidatus Xenobiia bacterium LiM19]
MSFSADGRYIASAEESGVFKTGGVTVWNWRTGEAAELFGRSSQFTDDSALFSNDGRYIAAWTRWGSYLAILDSQTGSLIRKWGISEYAGFSSVCISRESSLIAISGEGKGICVFNAGSGESVSNCRESSCPSECLCFSPGDSYIASGDSSGIRVWDVFSGKLIISIMAFNENDWGCWTPDGHYNCSSAAEQRLLISFWHFRKPVSSFGALLKDPNIMKKRFRTVKR